LSDQPLDPQTEAVPPSNLATNRQLPPIRTNPGLTSAGVVPSTSALSGTTAQTFDPLTADLTLPETPEPDTPEISGMKKFLAAMLIRNNPNLANVIMQGGFTQFEKNRQAAAGSEQGLQDARAAQLSRGTAPKTSTQTVFRDGVPTEMRGITDPDSGLFIPSGQEFQTGPRKLPAAGPNRATTQKVLLGGGREGQLRGRTDQSGLFIPAMNSDGTNQLFITGEAKPRAVTIQKTDQGLIYVDAVTKQTLGGVTNLSGTGIAQVPLSEGARKEIRQTFSMKQLSTRARASFEKMLTTTSQGERTLLGGVQGIPFGIGETLDRYVISFLSPEITLMSREFGNLADKLLRLQSGAQINEQEFARLRAFLPHVGENPQVALDKFKQFDQELADVLANNMTLNPGRFTEEVLAEKGFSLSEINEMVGNTAGGGVDAEAKRLLDEFNSTRRR